MWASIIKTWTIPPDCLRKKDMLQIVDGVEILKIPGWDASMVQV